MHRWEEFGGIPLRRPTGSCVKWEFELGWAVGQRVKENVLKAFIFSFVIFQTSKEFHLCNVYLCLLDSLMYYSTIHMGGRLFGSILNTTKFLSEIKAHQNNAEVTNRIHIFLIILWIRTWSLLVYLVFSSIWVFSLLQIFTLKKIQTIGIHVTNDKNLFYIFHVLFVTPPIPDPFLAQYWPG